MPSVTYKRLDGTVSLDKRHEIVKNFNSDPSIDVLLLTTHVGGLGLNLTGADTVIFFEHDWNPMKDGNHIIEYTHYPLMSVQLYIHIYILASYLILEPSIQFNAQPHLNSSSNGQSTSHRSKKSG